MILLDTTVLSLAFRRRTRSAQEPSAVTAFRGLISEDVLLRVPGIVLQELLSGVRSGGQFRRLERLLQGFTVLIATRNDQVAAAQIANSCRRAGVSPSSIDCLIAAMSIRSDSELFTLDPDFVRIAPHCGLRLYGVEAT